jgi:hypothetical protein
MTRVFKSKVDGWLAAVAIGPGLVVLPVLVLVMRSVGELTTTSLVVLASVALLAIGLPLWIFQSTRYTITDGTLEVRCGPLRESVALTAIEQIATSRSPRSAPALSLDRIAITFHGGRTVLVSPEDRRGFLATLAAAGVKAAVGVSP